MVNAGRDGVAEVGTSGIASFRIRAVCRDRNLQGVEDFQENTIRHSKSAASRFAHEAAPALNRFAESSARALHSGHPRGAGEDRGADR
jgi:hypothetical protein